MAKKARTISYPGLLRGSLINLSRKCGKPNCLCAQGKPHVTPALSYSVKGKTQLITLRQKDLPAVKRALSAYRRQLDALDKQALAGLTSLRRKIEQEKKQDK